MRHSAGSGAGWWWSSPTQHGRWRTSTPGSTSVLALLFLPLLRPFASQLRRWLPDRINAADPSQPLYLAEGARETPAIALSGAVREALRMTDVLDTMLRGAREALEGGDRKLATETRRLDDVLDRLNAAIKTYVTGLDPDDLSPADHRRMLQILAFTINIEHAGDILDRDVMAVASKRAKRGLAVMPAERTALAGVFDRLSANLRTAGAVFLSEDGAAARRLVAEKEAFRELEAQAMTAHFAGLRGAQGDGGRSGLHLDLLRDLARVNTHLVAAAAYPVLEADGGLLPNRVRPDPDPSGAADA